MKIAVIGDLHLPHILDTPQWDFWSWAKQELAEAKPDAIVVIGDISADGSLAAIRRFRADVQQLPGKKLIIRGNSDLRSNVQEVKELLPDYAEATIGPYRLIAADDGTGQAPVILPGNGDEKILLFTHFDHSGAISFPENLLLYVYGHIHRDSFRMIHRTHVFSINGCDPDKGIGAPPQITYFDVEGQQVQSTRKPWVQAGFFSWTQGEKEEFCSFLGISCYDPVRSVKFATENKIQNIELRPNALDASISELVPALKQWREKGGKYLSFHMPDIGYADGTLQGCALWEKAGPFVKAIQPDGLTVHVPKASVQDMQNGAREAIGQYAADWLRALPQTVKIGIENMHMTDGEPADHRRRYGYLPEECAKWAMGLSELSGREVLLHLDVGHARNNRPFSEKYTLGVWYQMIGSKINAYHIHQTSNENGVFHNHQPISGIYEELIAYGSFLESWKSNRIAHRPMLVEVKDPNLALESIKVFIKAAKEK